jgi:hypothetical protein
MSVAGSRRQSRTWTIIRRWTDFVNYRVAPQGGPKPHWSVSQVRPPVSDARIFAKHLKHVMQTFDKV